MIAKLKQLFTADFQEEAFVDADTAYFEDPKLEQVADARYTWFTFNSPERRSRSTLKGHVIDHAMVKWDAVGRDHPGEPPRPTDLIIKDGNVLERVLRDTRDSELAGDRDLERSRRRHRDQPQLRLLFSRAVAAARLLHATDPQVTGRAMKQRRATRGSFGLPDRCVFRSG